MSEFEIGTLVAYAPIKDVPTHLPLYPSERQREVERCKNSAARCEKYLVWKLLEKLVNDYIKVDFANLSFTKTDNGQWICPDFYFSLSHTKNLVCVAISLDPVGVDAELVRGINSELKGRILTERELSSTAEMSKEERGRYLLESWVKKESIFKKLGGKALLPNRIEVSEHHTTMKYVNVDGEDFIISVACNHDKKIEFKYMEDI